MDRSRSGSPGMGITGSITGEQGGPEQSQFYKTLSVSTAGAAHVCHTLDQACVFSKTGTAMFGVISVSMRILWALRAEGLDVTDDQ